MGTHSALLKGLHTKAYTAKQEPSLPRPQCGFVPPAKFFLFRHTFIYIHFPVFCGPPLSADEKKSAKLPPQLCPLTVSHPNFQLLAQTPHVCFRTRKRVHTRLSEKNRTQRHTRRNTGLPDGAAITTLDTSCTFTNIPGPGVRTANFAAFEPWPGALPKNAESLRNSDALMRVAAPRRRGPAGLRCSVCNLVMLLFFTLCAVLSERARRGVVSLPSACFAYC